jgi:hypothetical protein
VLLGWLIDLKAASMCQPDISIKRNFTYKMIE